MNDERVLKKDLFGKVTLRSRDGERVVVRDTSVAHWSLRWLARRLMQREAAVLACLEHVDGVPRVLRFERDLLTRSYLRGSPMHEARPTDLSWFNNAAALLRRLHRAGVVHNDLAKEPNVLVLDDGRPAFIDFQIAWHSRRRGRLFRIAGREDIRHLLKHKRTYCPDHLTAREHSILTNPSPLSTFWMRTFKPVYLFLTRKLLGWADREGASDRGATS
ncbi:MAG: RIO1 family regulatory kinase/ATPase [Woeseiaceae bacterium]|nr:RIO1 family regulatory kinase/ATPase [Woeseiaceae bacterium]